MASRVFNKPLLITQEKANAILAVLSPKMGFNSEVPIEIKEYSDRDRAFAGYSVNDGIAYIPVYGTLVARGDYLDARSGITGYNFIQRAFSTAQDDDAVRHILQTVNNSSLMKSKIELSSLIEDVEQNELLIAEDDSQFHRRNYVRSLFSLFEASLSNLREDVGILLNNQMIDKGELNIYELLPVLDDDVQLVGNGKINLVPNKYPFKALVGYIFKKYAELIDIEENLLGNHKWESFQEAIRVRNRITHPTEGKDSIITDEEINTMYEAKNWWNESVRKLSEP